MRKLSTNLSIWVNDIRQIIFPASCLFCHQPMSQQAVQHSGCCSECLKGIQPIAHACTHCGEPMDSNQAVQSVCGRCLSSPPAQLQSQNLFAYRGGVRDAILALKQHQNDAGVRWLLDAADQRLSTIFQPQDLLVPIPMPLTRMRQTGIHHAATLSRMIASHIGCCWDWQMLRRIGDQFRQSGLTAKQRRKNLRNAFGVCDDYIARLEKYGMDSGARLWLIDDVMTTGATMDAAASVLRKHGIDSHAFSLARTLKEVS